MELLQSSLLHPHSFHFKLLIALYLKRDENTLAYNFLLGRVELAGGLPSYKHSAPFPHKDETTGALSTVFLFGTFMTHRPTFIRRTKLVVHSVTTDWYFSLCIAKEALQTPSFKNTMSLLTKIIFNQPGTLGNIVILSLQV